MLFQHAGAARIAGRLFKFLACGVARRNHPFQISSRLVKGFGGYSLRVPKIGCFSASHDRRQQCYVRYYRESVIHCNLPFL